MSGLSIRNAIREYLDSVYWERPARYFVHQIDYNTLAASANNQAGRFTVDSQNDFLCLQTSMVITTDAAGGTEQPFPEITAQIQSDSGSFWNDGLGHAGNLFGRMVANANSAGPGPFTLPYPRFIQGGQTVTVRLTNLEANARRVWLAFHGAQIDRP